jgi:putative aminopeptidase FrvX
MKRVVFFILIASCLFAGAPARAAESSTVDALRKLIAAYGVSGYEGPVRGAVEGMLPAWAHPKTDAMGNLILQVGSGSPSMLFIAHMDEIGYYVTAISPDGFLRVRPAGGFWPTTFDGRFVLVHAQDGDVPGVVATKSIHLTAGDEPPFTTSSIFVDVGATSRAEVEALGIRILDSMTIKKEMYHLAGDRYAGRSMDDRFGCAALVQTVRAIDPAKLHGAVTFVWSVQEELGTRGAAAVAKTIRPDYVFPVDSFVSSDSPLESPQFADTPLGRGFVLRAFDNSNLSPMDRTRKILAWLQSKNIVVQIGATGGGNDGENFWSESTQVVPMGIPLRYSHSMEVMDMRDENALIDGLKDLIGDGSWRG